MEKLHKFLKVFIFVQLGACAGRALAKYLDYVANPGRYIFQCAPWYTGIIITVILTAITVSITLVAWLIVGHCIKKRREKL